MLEVNQLSTSSIALWHALMHIANKTGWQDTFTVAMVVLEIKSGLNKQAVLRARNVLKEKGLIDFEKRGNQAAKYKMISVLQCDNHTADNTTDDTTTNTTSDTTNDTTTNTTSDTINKLNKTKLNNIYNTPLPPEDIFKGFNFVPELKLKLNEWLKYKAEKKQSYKPQGRHSLFVQMQKAVDKYGPAKLIDLIDLCMANNWQGIIWDKLNNNPELQSKQQKQNKFVNYEQRSDWNFDELKRLEREHVKKKLEEASNG